MIKGLVITILIALAELIVIVFTVKECIQAISEKKQIQKEYDGLLKSVTNIEENISNANKEKEKLNTGNHIDNINNTADILHKYAQKRKSES